jgi:hypothetical protein
LIFYKLIAILACIAVFIRFLVRRVSSRRVVVHGRWQSIAESRGWKLLPVEDDSVLVFRSEMDSGSMDIRIHLYTQDGALWQDWHIVLTLVESIPSLWMNASDELRQQDTELYERILGAVSIKSIDEEFLSALVAQKNHESLLSFFESHPSAVVGDNTIEVSYASDVPMRFSEYSSLEGDASDGQTTNEEAKLITAVLAIETLSSLFKSITQQSTKI